VTFRTFVRQNARWLAGGLGLTFFASFGQTFFIAMFASQYRTEFDLTHGQFGSVYMVGTLASAITLVLIGKVVDYQTVRRVSSVVIVALAVACVAMATAKSVATLILAIYLLRLAGQGMMSHTAMTAMGRWFVAERGRAVAITSAGHQLGEACFPFIVVAMLSFLDWRTLWWTCAVVLLSIALPLARSCFLLDRSPLGTATGNLEIGRQWTRREAVKDVWFWLAGLGLIAPSFIGTSVWFHQVHLLELKQWDSAVLVGGFAMMSFITVSMTLLAGQLIDRYHAYRLLPYILIPLGFGCMLLGLGQAPTALIGFMVLMGVCYGLYGGVSGSIWSEVYGTRHLGSIRSVVFACMVLASALGPGITGALIDLGVSFEWQLKVLGVFCLVIAVVQVPVSRHMHGYVVSNAAV